MLSEELAFEACAELANEMLEKHGVSDRYTGEALIEDFVGQNFRGIVSSLEKKYSLSMSDEEREGYVKKEEGKTIPFHAAPSSLLIHYCTPILYHAASLISWPSGLESNELTIALFCKDVNADFCLSLDKVIATLEKKAQPCIGVMQELAKLAEKRDYGLAVVSSSALRRVQASIKKVDQEKYGPNLQKYQYPHRVRG